MTECTMEKQVQGLETFWEAIFHYNVLEMRFHLICFSVSELCWGQGASGLKALLKCRGRQMKCHRAFLWARLRHRVPALGRISWENEKLKEEMAAGGCGEQWNGGIWGSWCSFDWWPVSLARTTSLISLDRLFWWREKRCSKDLRFTGFTSRIHDAPILTGVSQCIEKNTSVFKPQIQLQTLTVVLEGKVFLFSFSHLELVFFSAGHPLNPTAMFCLEPLSGCLKFPPSWARRCSLFFIMCFCFGCSMDF